MSKVNELFEKEKFDVLEKDFKKVNFSKLNKLIINHIDESRLKKQNLKISLIKRKMTICGWDIFRDCISKYNLTNNFYNDIHFWSSETVLLLQKKLKKNIVPIVSVYSMSYYHTNYYRHEFFTVNPKIINQLKVNKFTFENKDYIYFPYNEEKLEISDSDMIFIYFKNHLNKIVEVIEKKEQKEREQKLLENKDTQWRVSLFDQWENTHYKKCKKAFSKYMSDTNASSAPWYIIDAGDQKWAELQVMETLVSNIEVALQNQAHSVPILQNVFPLEPIPRLADIDLQDKILNDEEYKKELKQLQIELGKLHNKLYRKRIPVIITYEGWDAAGKGGNIKRITEALDPRGYEVHPIASPEPHEKSRHYLWRFWNRLPKTGHVAIFDRTWYGRVMVERLEGFCSKNDWQRAYVEINEFEKELADPGLLWRGSSNQQIHDLNAWREGGERIPCLVCS